MSHDYRRTKCRIIVLCRLLSSSHTAQSVRMRFWNFSVVAIRIAQYSCKILVSQPRNAVERQRLNDLNMRLLEIQHMHTLRSNAIFISNANMCFKSHCRCTKNQTKWSAFVPQCRRDMKLQTALPFKYDRLTECQYTPLLLRLLSRQILAHTRLKSVLFF